MRLQKLGFSQMRTVDRPLWTRLDIGNKINLEHPGWRFHHKWLFKNARKDIFGQSRALATDSKLTQAGFRIEAC